jgi:tRNA A37 methylthiotransferase MiaB
MTPNQAWEIFDDLVEVYTHPKMFRFLHVPVQAGNDDVLRSMSRRYKVDEFRRLISEFRKAVPRLTVSTDVICGFPSETEEQFMDTVRLIEEIQPDILNISRFWSRPGTDAAAMPGQLHGRETKERSRVMSRVFKEISLKKNRAWVGWKGSVLIDEQVRPGSMMGRNPSYKPVVIKGELELGTVIQVEIVDAKQSYLAGRLT